MHTVVLGQAVAVVDLDHRTISAPSSHGVPLAVRLRARPSIGSGRRMLFNRPHCVREPLLTSLPKHRSLARVLESDAQFADWTSRRRHEAALTQLLRKHLPRPLAERVRVTDCRDGVLELAASAGAIAATLRQRAADLRAELARDGVDVTEIRVRVQVVAITAAPVKRQLHQWDSRHATPLFELADRLTDGPLKAALARWSRRARGR